MAKSRSLPAFQTLCATLAAALIASSGPSFANIISDPPSAVSRSEASERQSAVLLAQSEDSFETLVIASKVPVAVVFEASWCPFCRRHADVMDKMARDFGSEIRIVRVDIDKVPSVAKKHAIAPGVPETVLFVDGKPLPDHINGAQSAETMTRVLGSLIGKTPKAIPQRLLP